MPTGFCALSPLYSLIGNTLLSIHSIPPSCIVFIIILATYLHYAILPLETKMMINTMTNTLRSDETEATIQTSEDEIFGR